LVKVLTIFGVDSVFKGVGGFWESITERCQTKDKSVKKPISEKRWAWSEVEGQ